MTDSPALTLAKGTLVVAFGEIDSDGDLAMKQSSRKAMKGVRLRYALLFATQEAGDETGLDENVRAEAQRARNRAFADHDDYLAYQHYARLEGLVLPAMHAALQNGAKVTLADLNKSTTKEIAACLKALVTLNPDLADTFPEVTPDPN